MKYTSNGNILSIVKTETEKEKEQRLFEEKLKRVWNRIAKDEGYPNRIK